MDDYNNHVHGYEIKEAVLFSNGRGVALAENPNAVQPFVTWMFTEDESGKRDYEWGHYTTEKHKAESDFHTRKVEYQHQNGVAAISIFPPMAIYNYFSTQRPVDIGTFPKTANGPLSFVNFDERMRVEDGAFRAWGILTYSAPLTEKQIDDYELRAARNNPDLLHLTPEQREQQTQVVGKWEQSKRVPDIRRLTWWYSDFGSFVKKEFVTDKQLSERYNEITARQKPSIAAQLAEGEAQAAKDNAARPAPDKKNDIGR